MNLRELRDWVKKTRNLKTLRGAVRKDQRGNPIENDVTVGMKMLAEIEKRAALVEDFQKKVNRYQNDIIEYLTVLEKRGIVYPADQGRAPEPKKPETPPPPTEPKLRGKPGPKPKPKPEDPAQSVLEGKK